MINRVSQYLEQENEECCEETCDLCDIINEYLTLLANVQSFEQVRGYLGEMFDDVMELSRNNLIKECKCKVDL